MKRVAEHAPVYDLGTNRRFAKELAFVRPTFVENQYFAGGFQPNFQLSEPCDFHADVEALNEIATGSVGSVISLEVLEHVQHPAQAVAEFYRILKPGGVCLISVPFMTSYHGKTPVSALPGSSATELVHTHEAYPDFWRFTHEGLMLLLSEAGFTNIEVYPIDGPLLCRLEQMKLARLLFLIPGMSTLLKRLDPPTIGKMTTRHFVVCQK